MSYIDLTKKDIFKINYTNLYLAEILISDYIENHNNYKGLTKSEIATRWNNDERYRKQFYPSYCQRKLDQAGGVLIYDNEKYKIKESEEKLLSLLDGKLLQEVTHVINLPNPVIINIEYFKNVNDKLEFFNTLKEKLMNGSPNDFEVITYAVLFTYLEIFGFSLKRFTSTNAADGGVDFIGGDVIYAVTTKLTNSKLESDINKTHAKKFFIYRNIVNSKLKNQIRNYINEGKISDALNVNQIIERYVNFLEDKDDVFQIVGKLKTIILNEYEKEIL
jgi:hypothetical protein